MEIKLKDLDIRTSSGIMSDHISFGDKFINKFILIDSLETTFIEKEYNGKSMKNLYKLKEQSLNNYNIEIYAITDIRTFDILDSPLNSIGVILFQNNKYIGNCIPVYDTKDEEPPLYISNNFVVNFLIAKEPIDRNTFLSFKINSFSGIISTTKHIKNKLDNKEYLIRD
ncbi:MAG: hypothetical protein M0R46_13630 [Candidatus Muirbacterium halophilum]|nr:hypothetical protein [Candidatus Muirbacterium halophilum]